MRAEGLFDLLCLTGPKQAMVDEDTGQPVPDRLMDQSRGHGRVDATGQATNHPSISHLGPDRLDL